MAEPVNSKRVEFSKGFQNKFILSVQKKTSLGANDLARLVGVHRRTVTDWRREKFLITFGALRKLCKRAGLSMPSNIKIKDQFWYISKGAKKGGRSLIRKYGRVPVDPEYRKEKWRQRWERVGRFDPNSIPNVSLPFRNPKPSSELAEFFGIMMGDGGMTSRQISITLHHIDDLEYCHYVVKLIEKLFKVIPSVTHVSSKSINKIEVSRTGLVTYLHSLGIVIGNKIKQQLDIPRWIKIDPNFTKACVRGLIDTDGCVFTNRYKVNNKQYSYKKIDFASASAPLRESMISILRDLGMTPSVNGIHVRLNSRPDVERYFKIIGSHNPKHLKRYKAVI